MQQSLVQFKQFDLDSDTWTPITLRFRGHVHKCWLSFGDDLKLRSDPDDSATEYSALAKNGTDFLVPCDGLSSQDWSEITLFHAQSAIGEQVGILTWVLRYKG